MDTLKNVLRCVGWILWGILVTSYRVVTWTVKAVLIVTLSAFGTLALLDAVVDKHRR